MTAENSKFPFDWLIFALISTLFVLFCVHMDYLWQGACWCIIEYICLYRFIVYNDNNNDNKN